MFGNANGFEADVNLIDHGKSHKVFTMKKKKKNLLMVLMIDIHASS